MKINPKGYWENETSEGHEHDLGLANELANFFEGNTFKPNELSLVLDVGCGDGFYTNHLNNFTDNIVCIGFDGNPNTELLGGKDCYVLDVSVPQKIIVNDWILCLEVGEHIPAEHESIFLDNITKNNKCGLILSWAVRGQGGDGHINCQNNDEIIPKIESRGYTYDPISTQYLRDSAANYPTPCYWFKNTLMVFRRNK